MKSAFTLIELLVVIAIIAILAVVVVLTLNPAQLLAESRDSNRIADMATLNSALNLYQTDKAGVGTTMGSSSVVYYSFVDPSATSASGTGCATMGLPFTPSSFGYHCGASSTYRKTDGSGWIPVNFQSTSGGSPFGDLPVDPANTSSSRLYYTYSTNGVQYEVTAAMESTKYKLGGSSDVVSTDGGILTVYEKGTKLGLEPVDYGDSSFGGALADYWPMGEGTGGSVYNYSTIGTAIGVWSGTPGGTSGYYSSGKGAGWAGYFDGSTDAVLLNNDFTGLSASTISLWFKTNADGVMFGDANVSIGGSPTSYNPILYVGTDYKLRGGIYNMGGTPVNMLYSGNTVNDNKWHFAAWTYNGTTQSLYLDGVLQMTATLPAVDAGFLNYDSLGVGYSGSWTGGAGGWFYFNGLIDAARVYSRALSASEIAALYGAGD